MKNTDPKLVGVCGIYVKTADNDYKPCLREPSHTGGHNPFSNTAPVKQEEGQNA